MNTIATVKFLHFQRVLVSLVHVRTVEPAAVTATLSTAHAHLVSLEQPVQVNSTQRFALITCFR